MSETAPYLADAAGRQFTLANPVTTLGRSPKSDVFIPDVRASRHHAEIHFDGDTCILSDPGSTNGTLVNGAHLTTPQMLHDGDEIAIASAVFTFHDPEVTFRAARFPLLVMDAERDQVLVNRKPVTLSPKEYALLHLLYQNKGKVHSKQEIAQTVWPEYAGQVFDYQIESLVKRLREKIEPDSHQPVLILTVTGRGYKLVL